MASRLTYLKGIDFIEEDGTTQIRTSKAGVIGVIGTAGKGPVNVPTLIAGSRADAQRIFGKNRGDGFTLPAALDDIFDQGGATVVVINVLDPVENVVEGEELSATLSPNTGILPKGFISSFTLDTTIVKGRSRVTLASITIGLTGASLTNADNTVTVGSTVGLLVGMAVTGLGMGAGNSIASITDATHFELTNPSTVTGVAAVNALIASRNAVVFLPAGASSPVYHSMANVLLDQDDLNLLSVGDVVQVTYDLALTENVDYQLNKETGVISRYGAASKLLPHSTVTLTVTRVDDAVDHAILQDMVIGDAGDRTGLHAFITASALVHVQPRILIATGFTHQKPDASTSSPVLLEFEMILDRLGAILYADCADSNEVDAVSHMNDFAHSKRIRFIYPWQKVLVPGSQGSYAFRPSSARFAGQAAAVYNDMGFHYSPSNFPLFGVSGISKTIDFLPGDPNCMANYLAEHNVSTMVWIGGHKSWGNTVANGSFISTRVVADMIYEALTVYHLKSSDRPMTRGLLNDIVDSTQNYIDGLRNAGAVVNGNVWISKVDNTNASLGQGDLLVDFDFSVPGPLNRLTFRAHITNGYLEEILTEFSA